MTIEELLGPVRKDIDKVDKALLPLLIERMKCSERVAEIKGKHGIPVLNIKREQEILDNIREKSGEYGNSAAAIYSAIMAISRERQHQLLEGDKALGSLLSSAKSSLELDGKKIICQGVKGAYSNLAAKTFFGKDCDISFTKEFSGVFELLNKGEGDFGVVPVENSAAGSVTEVYGLIMKYKFYICGAVDVSVNHCLCTVSGEMPQKVISHPQALRQCANYIAEHDMDKAEYSNTAAAAKAVAEFSDGSLGAICSKEAAEKYGLTIVEECIQDNKNNHTRFAVISKTPIFTSDADKISLCFTIPNITGSLYRTLERFSLAGLNLSKIESHPIQNSDFEYEFYLDFNGNIWEKGVGELLCSLSNELATFTFLGNYKEIR